MGMFTVSDAVTFIPSLVLSIGIQLGLGCSSILLVGIKAYFVPKPKGGGGTQQAGGKAATAQAKAQERLTRRQRKEAASDTSDLNGAEQLLVMSLSEKYVQSLEEFKHYDNLLFFGVLAITSCIVSEVQVALVGYPRSQLPPLMLLALAGYALLTLAKVELLSDLVGKDQRAYLVIIGTVGFVLSCLMLYAAPAYGLVEFGIERGVQSLQEWVVAVAKAKLKWELHPTLDAPFCTLLYALAGGATTTLLFTAAMRITRSYWMATRPPAFALDYVSRPSLVAQSLMHVDLLLPLATCLLWVRPLSVDILGLTGQALEGAKAASLLLLGTMRIGLAKQYLQSYCDTALLAWYRLKHGGRRDRNAAAVEVAIRATVQVNNLLFMKVATQALAPALLWLSYGCLLASRQLQLAHAAFATTAAATSSSEASALEAGPSTGEAASAASAAAAVAPDYGMDFLMSAAQWGGFWSVACWSAVSAFTLLLLRLGITQP